MDFLEVKKAEYTDGYKIRLTFSDGLVKVVDLRNSLKGKIPLTLSRFCPGLKCQ